jgi:DNA-binding MarR family transcriptional regulator
MTRNTAIDSKQLSVADTDADLAFVVWSLLHQTTDVISRAREKELSQYNIALRQVAALRIIDLLGKKATPKQLAQSLFRQPHTISSILDRMDNEGLIEKHNDLERRNLIRVSLTEKGKLACQQAEKRESIHSILSCLSDAEMRQLRSLLFRLRSRALEEMNITEKPGLPASTGNE